MLLYRYVEVMDTQKKIKTYWPGKAALNDSTSGELYLAMQPVGSWPSPWPGNLARPKHGTAQGPSGPGRPGPKDQDVPRPPPRPAARHGHGLVKEAAR